MDYFEDILKNDAQYTEWQPEIERLLDKIWGNLGNKLTSVRYPNKTEKMLKPLRLPLGKKLEFR